MYHRCRRWCHLLSGMLYIEVQCSLMGVFEVGCCVLCNQSWGMMKRASSTLLSFISISHVRSCCNCEASDIHCFQALTLLHAISMVARLYLKPFTKKHHLLGIPVVFNLVINCTEEAILIPKKRWKKSLVSSAPWRIMHNSTDSCWAIL